MNIANISDLPWFWIWLGASLAFAVISTGLLRFSKWQERRRAGRYAEPPIVQAANLPSVALMATGTGAVTLASLLQTGGGVALPSGAVSSIGPNAKLSH